MTLRVVRGEIDYYSEVIRLGRKTLSLGTTEVIIAEHQTTPDRVINEVNAVLESTKTGLQFVQVDNDSDSYIFVLTPTPH